MRWKSHSVVQSYFPHSNCRLFKLSSVWPTLEEPDVAIRVFVRSIDSVGNASPVTWGQGGIASLKLPIPDTPNIPGLKEEQLSPERGDGIKVCSAGVELGNNNTHGRRFVCGLIRMFNWRTLETQCISLQSIGTVLSTTSVGQYIVFFMMIIELCNNADPPVLARLTHNSS